MPREIRGGSGPLSRGRFGNDGRRNAFRHGLHLPDASGSDEDRPRLLPDLRYGARAARCRRGGRSEPRADRHDPALLDRCGAHRPADGTGHGRACTGRASFRPGAAENRSLAPVRPGDAGRALGRPALLSARVGVDPQPQSQHVHVDRPRHRGGLRLQRRRHRRARPVPRSLPRGAWCGRCLLRGRRGDYRARPAGTGVGAASARAHRIGRARPARSCAREGPPAAGRRWIGGDFTRRGRRRRHIAGASRRQGAGRRHGRSMAAAISTNR